MLDYQHRYEEAITRLVGWVRDGRLRYREEIVDGIENCPNAIAELTGEKTSASGSSIFTIIKLASMHRERLFVRFWHLADVDGPFQ